MILSSARTWFAASIEAWDQFWFTPRLPHTLSVLRIVTGSMLLYCHLVLATDLNSFLGDQAWIDNETARGLHDGAFGLSDWGRTYLWYLSNPLLLWLHHALTILVTACFAAGLLTRITAPAAWFLQVMVLHRLTGTLFGLDQIVTYSAMYLMLSPCGSWLSVDAWLRNRLGDRVESNRRLAWLFPKPEPSVAANVATRLLQLHLCVIYLFGGLAKARGTSWWDGTAMWYSAGNFEYQSLDLTWIAKFPRLASTLSNATLFWEISYVALVWPRLTRPIVLAMAFAVHFGIATFLGMITFGTMMFAANMIFVDPEFLLRVIGKRPKEEASTETAQNAAEHEPADVHEPADAGWTDIEIDTDEMAWDDSDLALAEETSKSSIGLGSEISILAASDNAAERAAQLDRAEAKLRAAAKKLKEKSTRIKTLEAKYRERVAKLKEREAKIKDLVDRKRDSKRNDS